MRLALVVICLVAVAPTRALAWVPPCAADDALSEAAAALLLEGAPVDGASLARTARAAGSDAPVVHALVARLAEEARVRAWLAALASRSDAPLLCGFAEDATRLVLLATAHGGGLSAPLSEDVTALDVSLGPAFYAPRLVVLDARGALHDVALEPHAVRAELPADAPRPLLVQLVATGPAGPRPVAERTVGGELVAHSVSDSSSSRDASLSERLRAERAAAAVPSVRAHRLLARAAFEQARAVCASGRVSHVLTPGASPDERYAALGIRARFVGEAVGRAVDLDTAWSALLASPSHRAALLDARFTDAGTGIATDREGRICVAVALASWPRLVPRMRAH